MVQIDIPFPQNCEGCLLSDDSGDYPYCWALHQNRGYTFDRSKKKFPNCPMKPVEAPKQDDELIERKKMCRMLFNRCAALTHGTMCVFCGYRDVCDAERSVLGGKWEDT